MKATLACLVALFAASAAEFQIPVERYKLPNGLRVVLSQDSAVPVVTVYMIFDVGARSEEKGRTGFAHLFEHMMFEGSANAPKGMRDTQVESNGGIQNGSTHPDFTDYYETLPSNKLATALWLDSDRMRSLAITDENLKNQKEAVKQERRLSFDNQPYATAEIDTFPTLMFGNWQSSHSLIGSFEDLNAASIQDVSKFFKTYYAPNNAALVIVGDIQIPAAKKLIESYFSDIPEQPQPKHPDMTEPEYKAHSQTYDDPMARVPAVMMGWPGPKRRSPDYYAMNLLDAILTNGNSARFRLDLVKGKESIINYESNLGWPMSSYLDYRDPGAYGVFMLYKPNFTSQQIADQVQAEIAKLQDAPLPAAELERYKTQLRATMIRQLQSSFSRAQQLAQYEVADGDASLINTEFDRLLNVSAAQVQAAAKKYLSADKRTVLAVRPAPAAAASKEGK
ncbi:MAG TPA: pitrilysin family protein [Bryobacteraceae bacterium]|nr:pitrilysin family protein [Bryobacteraceae bacterium]